MGGGVQVYLVSNYIRVDGRKLLLRYSRLVYAREAK